MDAEPVIIDGSRCAEIVQRLSEKLKAYYVFPDVAEQICKYLQKHLENGAYSDFTEGNLLALALTMDLQEVSQDEHLWVRWHPEPLPDHEGPLRQNQEWMDERSQEAKLDNFGFHKAERLPGNVGYIDIRSFSRAEWGAATAMAAMNFLAETSALIIDMRRCEGGYADMIALVCSYLFDEEPVHLNSIYWREEDSTQQYWTQPDLPGKRYGNKPVYALISKATFSGGEECAYDLQSRQRATLIGEKTGGGANPGASYRLNSHFEAFIPVGRAINPITHKNWEGTGVIPDILVPQEQAFKTAYRLALKSVIESTVEPAREPFASLVKEVQNALEGIEAG